MRSGISSGVKLPRFNDPANDQRAQQGQIAQQTMQHNALAMQSQQATLQREAQRRAALSQIDTNAPDYNQQAQRVERESGDPEASQRIDSHLASMSEAKRKEALDHSQLFEQVVRTMGDKAGYMRGRAELVKDDPSAANMIPAEYSPENIEMLRMMALTVQERLSQRNSDRTYNLAVEKEVYKRSPAAADARLAERAAGAPRIINKGEDEHAKQDAKYYQGQYVKTQKAADSSMKRLYDYKLIHNLIGDAYSGIGAEKALAGKKLLKIVGVDLGDVSGPEAAASVSNMLALELRNPAGGEGMPGAMSDRDREFLLQMVPGLSMTKEGRAFMIEIQKRKAARFREQAKDARDYRLKHKYLDVGFDELQAQKWENNDIFSDLYETDIGSLAGEQPGGTETDDYSSMSDDELLRALQ